MIEVTTQQIIATIAAGVVLAYLGWLGSTLIGVQKQLTAFQSETNTILKVLTGDVADLKNNVQDIRDYLLKHTDFSPSPRKTGTENKS